MTGCDRVSKLALHKEIQLMLSKGKSNWIVVYLWINVDHVFVFPYANKNTKRGLQQHLNSIRQSIKWFCIQNDKVVFAMLYQALCKLLFNRVWRRIETAWWYPEEFCWSFLGLGQIHCDIDTTEVNNSDFFSKYIFICISRWESTLLHGQEGTNKLQVQTSVTATSQTPSET